MTGEDGMTENKTEIPRLTPPGELVNYPPPDRWDDWEEYDSNAWPKRVKNRYRLVPTACFNCESACGLLAYVDKDSGEVRRFEGNPEHPGSRGRNCAKGPATLNQMYDPERILYPLKRKGPRGSGEWEQVTWTEALADIGGRIGVAIREGRQDEIMYHVGRPGEDGFMERTLRAWGVDGHNSHTNICSAGARTGYAMWMGYDRPSPDFANARFILLLSSHLETGHYFNPHAQRIMEAKRSGAKLATIDPRLSNTASMSDFWLSPWPGTEAAMLLAIAKLLLEWDAVDHPFMRSWVNWEEALAARAPDRPRTYDAFVELLKETYSEYTLEFAAEESGVDAWRIEQVAKSIAAAGNRVGLAHLAGSRIGQPARVAGGSLLVVHPGADRLGRNCWRHLTERLGQVQTGALEHAAAAQPLERAAVARRVSVCPSRDELPAALLLEGGKRQSRRVFLPGLQPGVDQSGWLLLD